MSLYQVTITENNEAAPNDGFVDPTTVYQYLSLSDSPPTTYAASVAKSRANRRHKWVVLPSTPDENNPGVILTDVAAVTRFFARCLIRSEITMLEALDPTLATAPGNTTQYARTGPRFDLQTVGPVFDSLSAAEAAITTTVLQAF